MSDEAPRQEGQKNHPRPMVNRRHVLTFGSALALAAAGGRRLGAAAQDTTLPELSLSPDVEAYYTPGTFDGEELNVVINASSLAQNVMEPRRQEFNELTGAKVEYVPLPENQMYDQVRLDLLNSSGRYDMMHTGAGGAKDFGLSEFLVPLPKPPDIEDLFAGDVAQYSIGEELYGLPMIADTNLLYWRTDLFEQAGLDPTKPPETYDQFREYALKLTTDSNGKHPGEDGFDRDSIEVFGSAYKGVAGLACTWEWYNYLYAFGGDLVDADYNPTLNSPESVASLQWVVDNFQEHRIYPPDIPSYDYTEFHTLFLQGRMALAINWPYMWNMAQDPAQSKVVDKVMLGRKPGQTTHGGNIGGWSWNIFKMSEHQDLALAFAKWMASPEASLQYAVAGQGNSVRKSIASIMTDRDPVLYGAIAANQADGRGVKWLDTGASWLEIEKVQYEAIQRALIGDADPRTAMDDSNEAAREILEKNQFFEDLLPKLTG